MTGKIVIDHDNKRIICAGVEKRPLKNGKFRFEIHIPIFDLVKIYEHILYDPNAQRGLNSKGDYMVDPKRVKIIQQALIDGEELLEPFVLNLRNSQDTKPRPSYDAEEKILVIPFEQLVFIVDGKHRLEASKNVSDKGMLPESYVTLQFYFKNFYGERKLFSKLNSGKKNVSTTLQRVYSEDKKSKFVLELIKSTFLHGKVEMQNQAANHQTDKFISFASLESTLFGEKGNFRDLDFTDDQKVRELLAFLIEFTNFISEVRKELEWKNKKEKQENKKGSLVLESWVWYGFYQVAKELYGKPNWKEKLEKILTFEVKNRGKMIDFYSRKNKAIFGEFMDKKGNIVFKGSNVNAIKEKFINIFFQSV